MAFYVLFALLTLCSGQTSWPSYGGSASRPSSSMLLGPSGDLVRDWKYTFSAGIGGSAIVDSLGNVYIGTSDWGLYKFNKTGGLVWKFVSGNQIYSAATLSLNESVVFSGSSDGNFYGINAYSGAKLWQTPIGGCCSPGYPKASALDASGAVYFTASSTIAWALNGSSGVVLWTVTLAVGTLTAPALFNGSVFIGSASVMYALNASNGRQVWNYTTATALSAPAIDVATGTVVLGGANKLVYALSASTGNLVWSFTTGGAVTAKPAISPLGCVFVGSADRKLWPFNITTGALLWTPYLTLNTITADPVVAVDNTVYFSSTDNNIYGLDGAAGVLVLKVFSTALSTAFVLGTNRSVIGNFGSTLVKLNSQCYAGFFGVNGTFPCSSCIAGFFSAAGSDACTPCPAGSFASATGSALCQQCPGGHFCPAGTSSVARLNCGRGNYCPDGSGAPTSCPVQVPPIGGWDALQVQGPAFLVETARCLNHCFWNYTSGDGMLSKC